MTTVELSRDLALAIGYRPEHIETREGKLWVYRPRSELGIAHPMCYPSDWHVFDCNDPATAFKLAEAYHVFPHWAGNEWVVYSRQVDTHASTPQLAITAAILVHNK